MFVTYFDIHYNADENTWQILIILPEIAEWFMNM